MIKRAWMAALAAAATFFSLPEPARAGATLDAVKARGQLVCGIHTGVAGFALPDSRGIWRGLDIDLCRGLAVALFGDAEKVRFQPLSSSTRFTALGSGEVDVLFRTSTHTLMRDVTLGLRAVTPYFYDGHGFMVRAGAGITKASEMGGATICLISGTTNELVTADYFRTQNLTFTPILFERTDQAVAALQAGRCDSFGTDASQLAASRSSLQNPNEWTILAERFSKEPYGPYVRRGDEEWFDLVRWYVNALMEAEERGVTAANVEQMRQESTNPDTRRLLGATPEIAQALKLDPLWVVKVIKSMGNYGEIYERNMGLKTPIGLARGPNELWTRGGLLYPLPMR
ncbi:amino acid ABC transporter substrate-binding protein (plasmid) [Roseomonas marmotae]|uniref:Amino acid ABC transporter substrate-binding protein n=3 Tax=Roseomonas marmotae TaxID=2768161 RepID=A0ABS3KKH9_9PROT|nr:amino acid ABC transporter substrate-binding protein [Roseomonas marmotae]MBO1076836.1 amino acid ABC transporter substrate-binding protein [Roseomonas marmotae]QTI81240.1 amino acid ABC transporter substrate-binding protein [Roseomonas marmotae]